MLSWFWGDILGQEIPNLYDPNIQYYCTVYCMIMNSCRYVRMPTALRLWAYISGKSLVPMLQL